MNEKMTTMQQIVRSTMPLTLLKRRDDRLELGHDVA
jgi:hypothetical protein